jgi:very-short-patch-repair endonuclease
MPGFQTRIVLIFGIPMPLDGNTLRELAIKVSQYFLDFLESDFKRQQAPRRRIVLQTESGFRAGMKVAAYPGLQRNLWQLLEKATEEDLTLKFQPRTYTRPITATLRGIIREQINAIGEEVVELVRGEVMSQAATSRGRAIENPEQWVGEMRSVLAGEIGTQVVRPLLALLDGPLSHQAYSVQDSIFSAEGELIDVVASKVDAVLPDVLSKYLATGDAGHLRSALADLLTVDATRESLMAYFESFIASDAFLEFRDLETYAATGENLQLYLYLGVLKYGSLSFPVFYVPIDVERLANGAGFSFKIQNHLYANKRAIDFVLQELGERQKRQWLSPISERISYLTPQQSIAEVARPLFRKIANVMDLGGQVELDAGSVKEAGNTSVLLSTAMHFAVSDRADEALLNDYEEMIEQARTNAPGVVQLFEGIVGGVLMENPISIDADVEREWDALPLVDRMVIDSPVPLNEEQIKILSAIRNPVGKIVVVEGPPGTGKSHTITAIAADCALNNRSCLILSDKTEALDVVQNKLSDAMNQVRHDSNFPNPILRLGQDQANFKRLTSSQALTQVSAYVKATKANQPRIEAELGELRNQLKGDIEATVHALGGLAMSQIAEVYACEGELAGLAPNVATELRGLSDPALLTLVTRASDSAGGLESYLASAFGKLDPPTPSSIALRVKADSAIVKLAGDQDWTRLALVERLDGERLRALGALLLEYDQLRMPVFGHLFCGKAVRAIEQSINAKFDLRRPVLMKRDAATIRNVVEDANGLRHRLPDLGLSENELAEVYAALVLGRIPPAIAVTADELIEAMTKGIPDGLPVSLSTGDGHVLARIWAAAARFLKCWIPTAQAFEQAPEFDYVTTKGQLEHLNVSIMNAEVDSRLVHFMNTSRTDAKTLASVISRRQKFPEDKFATVQESFPVILASIRQFGEYMPLAPDLFDVVVIDEASQVSVAQAFPALLRAKKVVVLGDSKQFSNTKSSNASIALNEKYRSDLHAFFRQRVSTEASMLQRLARFDVKCSILDFCQLCANYHTMLRKHFRSYQELISYSSTTFYNDQLQAIKIRDVPLEDVIRFDLVEAKDDRAGNGTNQAEADFILEQILDLLDDQSPPTVGVITPFREQQTLLSKLLFGHARGAEMQDRLRLKVMTFDSCQGEERKIIFYSMVATETHDALNYVFPVALVDAQESVEEKLKMQRLNVGFSRAEELIWFVHSKPIGQFKGSIAKALQHYENLLKRGELRPDATDPNSPMEKSVLDWLQKTPFYQRYRESIEILPQFPIGEYLRQLDPTYRHPKWRVDFLLTFATTEGVAKIVIEYDGFEHHFQKGKDVNVGNHERYLVEGDIERQLTLESYGYRFLRVNRFNLGRDPVQTLSDRLERMLDRLLDNRPPAAVEDMQEMASGIASKELKPCSRCGEIKPQEAFFDGSLRGGIGGYGRVCVACKQADEAALREKRLATVGSGRRRWRRRW